MDTTVRPADDFFRYVNGQWLDNTEIPADRERWGSFDELRKNTDANTLALLREAMQGDGLEPGSDQAKAVRFFQTAMDTTALTEAGIAPLTPWLERIDALASIADLTALLADMKWAGAGPFVDFGVYADLKNSKINTVYLGTGDLGLPERDYYMKSDSESVVLRTQYVDHITSMFGLIGIDEANAKPQAEAILALETRMAESLLPKEERRNPYNTYHPKALADIQAMTPSFPWNDYLTPFGLAERDTIVVSQPAYLARLEEILAEGDIPSWQAYLRWMLLHGAASYLAPEIEAADFAFYGKTLRGLEQMKPRDERALAVLNGSLGEALGKLYVDTYFPPEAKAKAVAMVDNILDAFGDRIEALDWMSDTTKEMAQQKLATFTVKIGYPDKWKDYGDLEVSTFAEGGSYLQNMVNAAKWNLQEDLAKVDKEVDRSEWFMSPQTVNAYYNPLYNEIVFPAAILQPPFYNYQADEAVNYGGIGAVIGHEISHGFDDQGSRFDHEGNLNNWWTESDMTNFTERNRKLVEQFNSYEPLPGVTVNGEFTLGENIGDLGGVNVAYAGLQKFYAEHGQPEPIDGYTGEQRFFLSWGTIWRTKMRDEALKTQIATDPHSPGQYRAIGPLVNMPEFYEAFQVQAGDPLYRTEEERVKIW